MKSLVADLSLDQQILKDVFTKKPARLRTGVSKAIEAYQISERRACRIFNFGLSACRYRSVTVDQAALRMRLKEPASVRIRHGYRRLHILLRREGWDVNAKRVYRLYKEEKLSIRTKTSRQLQ